MKGRGEGGEGKGGEGVKGRGGGAVKNVVQFQKSHVAEKVREKKNL